MDQYTSVLISINQGYLYGFSYSQRLHMMQKTLYTTFEYKLIVYVLYIWFTYIQRVHIYFQLLLLI